MLKKFEKKLKLSEKILCLRIEELFAKILTHLIIDAALVFNVLLLKVKSDLCKFFKKFGTLITNFCSISFSEWQIGLTLCV